MTRPIAAATLAALEGDVARPIFFLELQLDGGDEFYHTGLGTIVWNAQNWLGVGEFGRVESIGESNKFSPRAIKISLSGLSADITSIVFDVDYYLRPCILYLGAMSLGALIENPSVIFSGYMESLQVVTGEKGSGDIVSLVAESELIRFKRSRDVRYTNTRLQSEFSGDLGLEYKEEVATNTVVWRGTANPLGGTPRDGGAGDYYDQDYSR